MPRAKHDPDEEPTATATAEVAPREEGTAPLALEPSPDTDDFYEPFPGSAYFHGGRTSELIGAMGRRLEQEGHALEGVRLGPDWTNAHRRAFAAHQQTLRPKGAGDVSGIPDEVAWIALKVPRVSPR